VPVAVSCVEAPTATVAVAGVTAIEIRVGKATVRLAVALTPVHLAVMVDCPTPCPVTAGDFGPATVATVENSDVHVVKALRSWVEPSLKVPMAEKVIVAPGVMKAGAGVIAIELSVAEVTVAAVDPAMEPSFVELVAVTVTDPADVPVTSP
jgi:hypothetical protein